MDTVFVWQMQLDHKELNFELILSGISPLQFAVRIAPLISSFFPEAVWF